MGIGFRIKEARNALNITQEELAKKLGVTKGAVANYENETSHPKEPIMYKLFDALQVDANYLFQDEMGSDYPMKVSYEEMNHIKKYRALDTHGKDIVDIVLDKEYDRCTEVDHNKVLPFVKETIDHLTANAAHERTDVDYTEEDRKSDDDMLD